MEIDIERYIDADRMTRIVESAVSDKVREEMQFTNISTILGNTAYEVVKTICDRDLSEDAKEIIRKNVDKIANNEDSVKFCLFYDPAHYGYRIGEEGKGVALKVAEKYFRESCKDKVKQAVDNIMKNLRLDTKKFEKMVLQEAAKMVAEKMTSNK